MKKIIFACSVLLLTVMTTTAQRRTTTTSRTTRTTSTPSSRVASSSSFNLAQTILLYGNIGFNSDKDASDDALRTNKFNFNAGLGYQFNDNWALGLALGFRSEKEEISDDAEDKFNEFKVGLFGRYTKPLNNWFNFYGQLDVGFKTSKDDPDGDDNETKASGIYAQVVPGFQVMVNNGLALNIGFGILGLETNKVEDADNSSSTTKFDFGTQGFILGISKNF